MMKVGFSSRVCPEWDLETIVTKAPETGFDGIELFGLSGDPRPPGAAELVSQPDEMRALIRNKNIELVCLGTTATLDSKSYTELSRQKAALAETVILAARLGCPYVRMLAGRVQRLDTEQLALSRIARALQSLVPVLSRHGVTLLVENGGDFVGSRHLWHLIDAVGHPAVQACWNQCQAMTRGEHATSAIPRLASKLGLVHLCDATFDEDSVLLDYKPLGEGGTEVAHQIDLLKGIVYDGYLVFDWPKAQIESLPAAESALPQAMAFMRGCVDAKQVVLSAYKGDKQAPKLAPRLAASAAG